MKCFKGTLDHQREVKNMPFWRRWSNKRRHTSAECHARWQRSGSVMSLQRWLHTAAVCALLFSEVVLPQLPSDTPCRTPLPSLEPHMDTNTCGQHGLQIEVSKPCRFSSAFITIITLPVSLFLWVFFFFYFLSHRHRKFPCSNSVAANILLYTSSYFIVDLFLFKQIVPYLLLYD